MLLAPLLNGIPLGKKIKFRILEPMVPLTDKSDYFWENSNLTIFGRIRT